MKRKATLHPIRNKRSFQIALISWFQLEGKDYPWRQTHDPWAILVSEVMLQQTQVSTVLGRKKGEQKESFSPEEGGHYSRFMALYPTPSAMAQADEREILKAWEGLGYYRRARNLHAAARAITENHNGIFPKDFSSILSLPGVGPYTAGAVVSFAYNTPQPIVDANVSRLFSRLFNFQERIDSSAGVKQLWKWAESLLFKKNPRHYNSALMELGQIYCTNHSPNCHSCPLQRFCLCDDPSSLPIKKSPTQITRSDEFALWVVDSHGRILLQQLQPTERRAGMWSLPRRNFQQIQNFPLVHQFTYHITRFLINLHIHSALSHTVLPSQHETWFSPSELRDLPIPSPDRKAIAKLIS